MPNEKLTQLQQAMIEHDDDMARLDRNTIPITEPITVESCLAELREIFPRYKYFSISVSVGAPRMAYEIRVGSAFYSGGVRSVYGETLDEAMAQIRAWKESQ